MDRNYYSWSFLDLEVNTWYEIAEGEHWLLTCCVHCIVGKHSLNLYRRVNSDHESEL